GERPPRKSYGDRPRRDDGDKPFRKSYAKREDSGDGERPPRKSYGDRPRRDDGDKPFRKPYAKREDSRDGERPSRKTYGDRPRRDDGDKPFRKISSGKEKKTSPRRTSGKDGEELIRLNKYISNAGICSRREADVLIQSGVITVNGEPVTEMGYKVSRTDKVKYGDQTLNTEKLRYVLLNKPKGFITTMEDPEDRKTVMALVENACKERIYPVGRLDRNTTGLLLFTNDGEMAKKLTHPKYGIRKIYHVVLEKNITKTDMKKVAAGMDLEDGPVQVDAIEYISDAKDKKEVGIELHSGQNRVVRRIFETLGHKVEKLDRVAYAGLTKKNLPRGEWRFLTEMEINMLKMIH
ncbi:MAG: pseudouridine synthase, partial [Syntrophothermus sp.]